MRESLKQRNDVTVSRRLHLTEPEKFADKDTEAIEPDEAVRFTAKVIHPNGSVKWHSGTGSAADFTEFFKKTTQDANAKEAARNARWLVDEKGWYPSRWLNIRRRISRVPPCIREYVRDIIAIELDSEGIYRVIFRYDTVLELRQDMEIISYQPGEWEHILRMWV